MVCIEFSANPIANLALESISHEHRFTPLNILNRRSVSAILCFFILIPTPTVRMFLLFRYVPTKAVKQWFKPFRQIHIFAKQHFFDNTSEQQANISIRNTFEQSICRLCRNLDKFSNGLLLLRTANPPSAQAASSAHSGSPDVPDADKPLRYRGG